MAETDPTTEPDAEVERLTREVFRLTEGPIVDYDKADPEHVEYLRMIVQHVLADRDKTHILVPRDGAREKTERRSRGGECAAGEWVPTIRESRTVVYGPWEVAP